VAISVALPLEKLRPPVFLGFNHNAASGDPSCTCTPNSQQNRTICGCWVIAI